MRTQMFETPLDKLKYILYKYTQDFSFIGEVPEDVVVKRANALMKHFETREHPPQYQFYVDLKEAIDEYVEDLLLNRPV
jgi:hypothetical protein